MVAGLPELTALTTLTRADRADLQRCPKYLKRSDYGRPREHRSHSTQPLGRCLCNRYLQFTASRACEYSCFPR